MFHLIPYDILDECIMYLDVEDFQKMCFVSKIWQIRSRDDALWHKLVISKKINMCSSSSSYKTIFIEGYNMLYPLIYEIGLKYFLDIFIMISSDCLYLKRAYTTKYEFNYSVKNIKEYRKNGSFEYIEKLRNRDCEKFDPYKAYGIKLNKFVRKIKLEIDEPWYKKLQTYPQLKCLENADILEDILHKPIPNLKNLKVCGEKIPKYEFHMLFNEYYYVDNKIKPLFTNLQSSEDSEFIISKNKISLYDIFIACSSVRNLKENFYEEQIFGLDKFTETEIGKDVQQTIKLKVGFM